LTAGNDDEDVLMSDYCGGEILVDDGDRCFGSERRNLLKNERKEKDVSSEWAIR
jgi:hypothetical protein